MYDSYQFISVERRGRVLTLTMTNPPLNAVHVPLHDELSQIFSDVARDEACDIVVLTGAGRAFSAGADFDGMLRATDDAHIRATLISRAPYIVHAMLSLEKPLVARVNGHAMGLGATLALLCDVVFATETAKIADSHVAIGLSAGDGGALLWPQLIGYPRARHHLLTGEPLTGLDAAAIGLIHKAVPADELDNAVYGYAERLAAGATLAIRATKRSINMALCREALATVEAHIGLEALTMTSADHREAILAFMEKRPPAFVGA